jgi:hypothetical protein
MTKSGTFTGALAETRCGAAIRNPLTRLDYRNSGLQLWVSGSVGRMRWRAAVRERDGHQALTCVERA